MPYIEITPNGPELRLFPSSPHCGADGPHNEVTNLIFVKIMRCRVCDRLFKQVNCLSK